MVEVLVNNPLLLLFLIAAISYPLGRYKIKGTSLGVAAVLFVSIAVGALDPDLKLPDVIFNLGIVNHLCFNNFQDIIHNPPAIPTGLYNLSCNDSTGVTNITIYWCV